MIAQTNKRNYSISESENGYAHIYISTSSRITIESWHKLQNIRLKMELCSFDGTKCIDVRHLGENPMRYINLHYRGLTVHSVKNDQVMPFPCWDIDAYAMFGSAEQYVAINRNNLLPNKRDEVYGIIIACAEEALRYLWKVIYEISILEPIEADTTLFEKFYKTCELDHNMQTINESDKHKMAYQQNALAVSVLYQQATALYNKTSWREFSYFNTIVPMLIANTSIRIIALKRRAKLYGAKKVLLRETDTYYLSDAFKNGIDTCWCINKQNFPGVDVYLPINITISEYFVQDIFSEYLRGRKVRVHAENVTFFESQDLDEKIKTSAHVLDCFIPVYTYPASHGRAWQPDEQDETQWLDALAYTLVEYLRTEEDSKDKNTTEETQTRGVKELRRERDWESLVIMPCFPTYSEIHMHTLPKETCPDELWNLGVCTVLPITYQDLLRWILVGKRKPCLLKTVISTCHMPASSAIFNPVHLRIDFLAKKLQMQWPDRSVTDRDTIKWNYVKALVDFLNKLNPLLVKLFRKVEPCNCEETISDKQVRETLADIFSEEPFRYSKPDIHPCKRH